MTKPAIDKHSEPIRLFESDFLEFFTHVSPITVIIIWLPVVGAFLYLSLTDKQFKPVVLIAGVLVGLLVWTLTEYLLHRFLFHFQAKTERGKRLSFLFHGIHHAQPRVKTRLVMPPVVSIPLALLFYIFFYMLLTYVVNLPNWIAPLCAGFTLGYLAYDLMHYGTHHFPVRRGYFHWVRKHHMHHHFQTPDMRFGVTSPLWDIVFGTMPE